jgi:hypothetical protein
MELLPKFKGLLANLDQLQVPSSPQSQSLQTSTVPNALQFPSNPHETPKITQLEFQPNPISAKTNIKINPKRAKTSPLRSPTSSSNLLHDRMLRQLVSHSKASSEATCEKYRRKKSSKDRNSQIVNFIMAFNKSFLVPSFAGQSTAAWFRQFIELFSLAVVACFLFAFLEAFNIG